MFKFNSLDNEDDGSYNPEKFLSSFNTIHGYVSEKLLKKKKELCLIPIMLYGYTSSLTSQQQPPLGAAL